jgi:hypothetical protein
MLAVPPGDRFTFVHDHDSATANGDRGWVEAGSSGGDGRGGAAADRAG